MAEGIAKQYLQDCKIHSAGTKPEPVNEKAISSMKKINIDISKSYSKKIDLEKIDQYDLVVTLCGEANANCPNLTTSSKHIHWDIADPGIFLGTDVEIEFYFLEIRNIIEDKIKQLQINIDKGLI